MQRVFETSSAREPLTILAMGAAVALAAGLAAHSLAWSLPVLERSWPAPPHPRDLGLSILEAREIGTTARDAAYLWSVRLSAVVTLAALGGALWRLRALRPQA